MDVPNSLFIPMLRLLRHSTGCDEPQQNSGDDWFAEQRCLQPGLPQGDAATPNNQVNWPRHDLCRARRV